MKIPKTPVEFDYDLWTTEEGKCMVRVKRTGEETEVDRSTMRVLRAEEKRLRRSMTGVPISGCEQESATLLSLDYVSVQGAEELSPSWLEDTHDCMEDVITKLLEEDLRSTLTAKQLDIYISCILGDMTFKDYASKSGTSPQSVQEAVSLIRKKAKNIF